ncbi:MAG: 16S rRNA (guanine(966)-N(2))-methyltransferase RsmD [Desulfotomaculales bacterium]
MIRVSAGNLKGRRLKTPVNWTGRPTTEMVKGALFNILAPVLEGSRFLDLFAGCGNVGIEALSRGARTVFFVEKDPRAVKVIAENLRILSLSAFARVMRDDVFVAVKKLGRKGERFEVIFLDPPYGRHMEVPVMEAIAKSGLLQPEGVLIAESTKREVLPFRINGLVLVRQEKYGDTMLTFYKEG